MSKFAPMVKMNTTEPSVILKLKKGGKVKAKKSEEYCEEHGHKAMSHQAPEDGDSPKRPSMAARNKAMKPVARKAPGGAMGGVPTANPMGGMMPAGSLVMGKTPAMNPMGAAALGKMAPNARAQRAMQVRKALTGMKKGGSTEGCAALEKELRHHESLKADVAHHAEGGSAMDRAMTKTTLKTSVAPFVSKINDVKPDNKVRKTGEVKQGNGGGYKTGGATKAYAAGGTIEGNEKSFENTKMNTTHAFGGSKDTGVVRMSNAGGYKKGGTIKGGDWENRAANTTPKGVSGTKTGEVRLANAGGYKSGGKTSKKAYATGGNVVDDGKAVKMPHHFVSRPVANSLQSGTFKRGGKVKHHAAGGSEPFGTFEDEDSGSAGFGNNGLPASSPADSNTAKKNKSDELSSFLDSRAKGRSGRTLSSAEALAHIQKQKDNRIKLRDEGMNMFDDQSAKAKGGRAKK